jgi:hypothetical protein
MEGPGADSEEKHEPASDIDTAWMDSLKVLDPEGPIREADIARYGRQASKAPPAAKRPHDVRSLLIAPIRVTDKFNSTWQRPD